MHAPPLVSFSSGEGHDPMMITMDMPSPLTPGRVHNIMQEASPEDIKKSMESGLLTTMDMVHQSAMYEQEMYQSSPISSQGNEMDSKKKRKYCSMYIFACCAWKKEPLFS